MSIAVLVGLGFGLTFMISAWLGTPVVFGYNQGPEQPIAFPHTRHTQQPPDGAGLDCTFCHRNVTEGAVATVPSAGLCLTCHQVIGDELPEVENLRAEVEADRPIQWVRVHRVPDHVHFVHDAHVRFFSQRDNIEPSAVCSTCHGEVSEMERVRQVRPLKMGDCVDCHRDNGAPTDCVTCHY